MASHEASGSGEPSKKRPRTKQAAKKRRQFVSNSAVERYQVYSSIHTRAKLTQCRYIDESIVREMHLDSIDNIFKDMTLDSILYCDEPIYEEYVWEFYSNFVNHGVSGCSSRVNFKDITFDSTVLNKVFKCVTSDEHVDCFFSGEWPKAFTRLDLADLAKEYFNVDKWNVLGLYKPKALLPLRRLLYEIICAVMAPSSGHSSEPTIAQIILLFCISEGIKVDFGKFMIGYMSQAVSGKKAKRDLPYGHLLTRLFKYFRISFSSEIPVKQPVMIDQTFIEGKKVIFKNGDWIPIEPKHPSKQAPKKKSGEGSSRLGGEDNEILLVNMVQGLGASINGRLDTLMGRLDTVAQDHITFRDEMRGKLVAHDEMFQKMTNELNVIEQTLRLVVPDSRQEEVETIRRSVYNVNRFREEEGNENEDEADDAERTESDASGSDDDSGDDIDIDTELYPRTS